MKPQVLICGAGPTGMVLALWLTKAGIPVRIIDKAAGPGTTSRATVVHARTLEYYRQLGIDEAAISRGVLFRQGNLWVNGTIRARLPFGASGERLSPYPYILIFPQDLHEKLLEQTLAEAGIRVERNTSLLSFEDGADGVTAHIIQAGGEPETVAVNYLAGCDGARSTVREQLRTGFPGGTYENVFYVADLKVRGPVGNGQLNAALDRADFVIVFPMQGEGRVRLIGVIKGKTDDPRKLRWEDVSGDILKRLHMEVEAVYWFSAYRVHHRVAATFRQGRCFLLGDAGHIHSPVGGQGMNTGIGDAVNLAWKLAEVLKGGAGPGLLDSYNPERIAFARSLVATTDRAFTFVDKRGLLATLVRTRIAPVLLRFMFRFRTVRKAAYLRLSQLLIDYRDSPLSKGRAGKFRGGDRLPWLPSAEGRPDNFDALRSRCWQVHVYGTAGAGLPEFCRGKALPLRRFDWSAEASAAGFERDSVFLIRPDGYIGLAASAAQALPAIEAYWSSRSEGRAVIPL